MGRRRRQARHRQQTTARRLQACIVTSGIAPSVEKRSRVVLRITQKLPEPAKSRILPSSHSLARPSLPALAANKASMRHPGEMLVVKRHPPRCDRLEAVQGVRPSKQDGTVLIGRGRLIASQGVAPLSSNDKAYVKSYSIRLGYFQG